MSDKKKRQPCSDKMKEWYKFRGVQWSVLAPVEYRKYGDTQPVQEKHY